MSDTDPLVTVATFSSLIEAEMARNALDAEGIRSFVADGEVANMAWYASGAIGGVKVQVAKSDFWQAERFLNSRGSAEHAKALDDYGLNKSTGITAHPQVVRDDHSDVGDEPPEDTEADMTLDRALKAAIFGFVLPPFMHLYSLWLLLQLSGMRSSVSPAKKGGLYLALGIDLVVLLVVLYVCQFCLFGLRVG